MRYLLPFLFALLPVAAGEPGKPSWRILRSFEGSAEGYVLGNGSKPEVTKRDSFHGDYSATLTAQFPGRVDLLKKSGIARIGEVELAVKAVPDAPRDLCGIMYVKDKDGLWWQSEAVRLDPEVSRRWCILGFDLYGDFYPVNHQAPFDRRFAAQIDTVGFRFFSRENWRGTILVDCLRGREAPHRPLAIRNLRALSSEPVPLYRLFEAAFDLEGSFFNPFDPDEVKVDATITTPSGKSVVYPCYFHQDYERRKGPRGEDLYIPRGPGHWRFRYAPLEKGTFRVRITAREGTGSVRGGELSFAAVDSGKGMPLVRVSKAAPFCFENTEGDAFYPIGHNVRSPTDPRCTQVLGWSPLADRGLAAYERYLPRMARNGENLAEVWMASWWLGIEWTGKWKGYHGVGRYNLQHAWMLDYLLGLAYRHGIYVHLVIDNHGKISSYCDREWEHSPYNRRNGGFLNTPDEFFTDKRARKLHRQKLRYIIARWAAFSNMMGVELISELDLTGSRHGTYKNPYILEWHKEMTAFFRSLDPYGHPLTTHFSGDFNVIDPRIAADPCIDYVAVDAYRGGPGPFPDLMHRSSRALARFKKPFIITEYGGAWNGTDEAGLRADLHSGLWSAACGRSAGTPMLWWFDFIDRRDLYGEYRAIRNFLEGEEHRRTSEWNESKAVLGDNIECLQYYGGTEGRAWVFDVRDMTYFFPKSLHRHSGRKVSLPAEDAEAVLVEYWNTREGRRLRTETIRRKENAFQAVLPEFESDIALKWKTTPLDKPSGTVGEPQPAHTVTPASTSSGSRRSEARR